MQEATASWSCARCWFRTTSDPDVALHEAQQPGHLMLARILDESEEKEVW